MAKKTRLDFTTTPERKEWLKTTADRQEISVSQLLNRLIRNRMLAEAKYKKPTNEKQEDHPVRILSKAEILAKLEEDDEKEEEMPF